MHARLYGPPLFRCPSDRESLDQTLTLLDLFTQTVDLGPQMVLGPPHLVFVDAIFSSRNASSTWLATVTLGPLLPAHGTSICRQVLPGHLVETRH